MDELEEKNGKIKIEIKKNIRRIKIFYKIYELIKIFYKIYELIKIYNTFLFIF